MYMIIFCYFSTWLSVTEMLLVLYISNSQIPLIIQPAICRADCISVINKFVSFHEFQT